jgi:hypothetical protein
MAQQQYDNSGILFKNDDKAQPSHADYQGNITVAGTEYWLNAWIKEGKKGKFMSLSVKPKRPIQTQAADKKAASASVDQDIPFNRIGNSHAL